MSQNICAMFDTTDLYYALQSMNKKINYAKLLDGVLEIAGIYGSVPGDAAYAFGHAVGACNAPFREYLARCGYTVDFTEVPKMLRYRPISAAKIMGTIFTEARRCHKFILCVNSAAFGEVLEMCVREDLDFILLTLPNSPIAASPYVTPDKVLYITDDWLVPAGRPKYATSEANGVDSAGQGKLPLDSCVDVPELSGVPAEA